MILCRRTNSFGCTRPTHLVNGDDGVAALVRIDPDDHHVKPDRPVLWCRPAAKEATATNGKTNNERTNRPRQHDIGNITSFWSLAQARVVITDFKHDYNHRHRRSAQGYQTPARYTATCTHR